METLFNISDLIRRALDEDIGSGDITSNLLISDDSHTTALYIAKSNFILAGMPIAKKVFEIVDSDVTFNAFFDDGVKIRKGNVLGEVSGKTKSLLLGERLSLNLLQRLSGISTTTRQYVDAVAGTRARILDTRKTVPLLRSLEKYAVRLGGGYNHRFGLYDGILIKDNHIEAVGSIGKAIEVVKNMKSLYKIEVEIENLTDLREAIDAGADIVMLDNMSVKDMKKAVKLASRAGILTEASGNVKLRTVREIAETGVDMISIGALTHSVVAADISMKIVT